MHPGSRFQHTLPRATAVEGFGLWSGRDVRVEFRPARAHAGIVFVREDLSPAVRIRAVVEHQVQIQLRTVLEDSGASVEMVEHILAALSALQIDNCEVAVNAPEMPGLDGSSQAFVEALDRAGRVTQMALRPTLTVQAPVRVGTDQSWIEASPSKTPGLTVRYDLDYSHAQSIGRQSYELAVSPKNFREQLATSRTFLLKCEALALQSQGLATRVTSQDVLVFDDRGPIGNPLRFADECVRHKALDLIGDLALAGCDLQGHVHAHCSGHRLNAELVRALLQQQPFRKAA